MVMVGGLEVSEEDAERLKKLVKDRAKATAYEIKQKAYDLSLAGFKNGFGKEWCIEFIKSFAEGTEQEQLYLFDDLIDLYCRYELKLYTLDECKVKVNEYIQKFITKMYMKEVGNSE
ncbi:MAG TPA: hypothetical protein VEF53_18765 [Patescibacteria group bacterium]|nr:hypothetical protein [Patescibacteria group bacterium]